ncbi:helix-turn-helix domain-containing protein [Nocardia terpenica]|uniref:helix-turn-helix domain-containing protein n=1 Tax=Nocardia terpenica TaxID=455432 RepID=UPI001893F169|nr:helix-turn-helix domain-containing protein [Nocardia terpenica]MBF6059812.1 helix-turn-helix domain-containing protein [Nocardia terpenica]MBF6102647.1 helix-turn-helix domain-containing protein [Nocardia terpenica]MBF6111162.1 helix-turn-helix domain-containing protein [Nocardia terpenica]MBF6117293.1 helix-turn-helix domain-containing protein [Nocardia terpenica]MBF6150866.1 helix-turn-helix domain-containing protein [Nocardia terpenica]
MAEPEIDRARIRLIEHARDPAVANTIVQALVRASRAASAAVAALPEEEVHRHVQVLVDGVVTTDRAPGAQVLAAAERLGSERARQGVPVEALLDAIQASRSCLIRMIIDQGQQLAVPLQAVLDAVVHLDRITTVVLHRTVHTHRETELGMARTRTERETQTLRQLLHGEQPASCAPLTASAAYSCVVSDISDPTLAQQLATALTAPGSGLCGLVDGRLAALVTRLPRLDDAQPLLVATPAATPARVAPLYRLARRALQAGRAAGLTGLHRLTDLALLTATHAEPELGTLLAAHLLGGLDPGDPFHRDLAETARAYLDHRGRIEPTAVALHIHTNTVKYRLRRFTELTGHTLTGADTTTVADTTQHWWALQHWLTHS